MAVTRSQLLTRKRELFTAIRVLEEDHAAGAVDVQAYQSARHRFEMEAAEILQQLDSLPNGELGEPTQQAGSASVPRSRRTSTPVLLALSGMSVLIVAVVLAVSLHGRAGGQSITGQQPGAVIVPLPTSSTRVLAAERVVQRRPRDVDALLHLAQAYSDSNDVGAADRVYLQAIKIDPNRPEAPTLHALVLAARKQYASALALLRRVEYLHPEYARAWLTDGLVASRRRPGYPRAIAAWNQFLLLMPHSSLAPAVRGYVLALRRAESAGR